MKVIIKESQPTRFSKPKSLNQRLKKEYNYIQWKISENDLQAYWSQLVKYIPNNVESWKIYYEELGHYYRSLIGNQFYRCLKYYKITIIIIIIKYFIILLCYIVRQKKMLLAKTLQFENTKLKKIILELEGNNYKNNI